MLLNKTLVAASIATAITLSGCNAVTQNTDPVKQGQPESEETITAISPMDLKESNASVPKSNVTGDSISGDEDSIAETQSTIALHESVQKKKDRLEQGQRRAVEAEKKSVPHNYFARGKIMADAAAPAMQAAELYSIMPSPVPSAIRHATEELNRENYQHFDDNPVKLVTESPVSTFSIDVDTGSYSNIRRMINGGHLPREDAVRVEELINYFSYDYPLPQDNKAFSVTTELGEAPWNKDAKLLHIGIKGADIEPTKLPASNLVFLVDVSGSMRSANKLDLLKSSLKLLTKQMRTQDKISLVVYAGSSGVVLEPTSGDEKFKIVSALHGLTAGGSTNGASGIRLAYNMAQQGYIKNGINRVIIATDGDFNVGTVNFEALKDLVEEKRKSGISLTTLGFGTGNYNDHLMEQLADSGNGNYAYIDTLHEAQKVLVDEMSSTLKTIAKDVKIQIEFNPAMVKEYRLIGYENRQLKREDFNNDKVDAGEIGAGHTVTALYEIILSDSAGNRVDPLRYAHKHTETTINGHSNELAFLRLRHKQPGGSKSTLIEIPIKQSEAYASPEQSTDRYRFSAAVASFGQLLRGGHYTKEFDYDDVLELARNARGQDRFGYRGEFIKLVNLAQSLATPQQTASIQPEHTK